MEGREVVLFPMPGAGHVTPMFHLAEALRSKGLSITIILTKYTPINPSNYPSEYTFHLIEDDVNAVIGAPLTDPMAGLAAIEAKCHNPFRDCLASILAAGQQPSQKPVACLITDSLWQFTRPVCKDLKLPRIVLFALPVHDMVTLTPFEVLQQKYHEFPEIMGLGGKLKEATAVICNSFEEIEGPSLKALQQSIPQVPIFAIGPLHKYSKTSVQSSLAEDQSKIISWLDNHPTKSVLYVSFGSVASLPESELEEIAWGLANSNQPFLWVVQNDSGHAQVLPEGFVDAIGERGLIVRWAPQLEVLKHTAIGGAFLHGGWNSTVEAVAEGVPMICMPCNFPDQKSTAKQIQDVWKNGLHVERGVKRVVVEKCVRTIMIGEDGKEIRENAATFKDAVIKCLGEGGATYESLEKLANFIRSL